MSGFACADAVHLPLRRQSVQCVITSPPYWGKRCYGDHFLEIGAPETPLDHYLIFMRQVFAEIFNVLIDDGTFWLNVGDTSIGSGGAGGDFNVRNGRRNAKDGRERYRQGKAVLPNGQRLPKGQLGLIPARLAMVAQEVGFLVRAQIVWRKTTMSREDVKHIKRPKFAWEPIFMLTKQVKIKWLGKDQGLTDVWELPVANRHNIGDRGPGGQAPFPFDLPEKCIGLSTDPGDVVLDPFSGGGTTAMVANKLGRVGIGLDLYEGG